MYKLEFRQNGILPNIWWYLTAIYRQIGRSNEFCRTNYTLKKYDYWGVPPQNPNTKGVRRTRLALRQKHYKG
jgi:hypothetical protein